MTTTMRNPRPTRQWRSSSIPPPLILLALPCTLAFFQPPPHADLSTLQKHHTRKPGTRRSSSSGTRLAGAKWPATSGGDWGVDVAAAGRRQLARRLCAVPPLFGKNRKRRKRPVVSRDSSSWYDDDDDTDVAALGGNEGNRDEAMATAAGPFSTITTAVAGEVAGAAATATGREPSSNLSPKTTTTASASFNNKNRGSPENMNSKDSNSSKRSTSTTATTTDTTTKVTDDALLPPLDDLDLDDDGNEIIIEPVWVEGETQGERPIVETYGLNDALATAEDGIDLDNGMMMLDPDDEEDALLIPADGVLPGGLGDGVGPESWRNGMEVPDDDVMLGERFNMVGRGLDDMLMERSIRFYDPKVIFFYFTRFFSGFLLLLLLMFVVVEVFFFVSTHSTVLLFEK